MALPRRWRRVVQLALAIGAALVVGTRWREDRFSCHLCRARKEVRTDSIHLWPVSRIESVSYPGLGPGHGHDWWRYSYSHGDGFAGCLGAGVACEAHRYRDGSTAP